MALIKNDNKQKKHKGENIIGKIIYGFLLFAPLLSILFRSMYVTFNRNAYLSYSDNYINSTLKITSSTQLIDNGNYVFNYQTFKNNNYSNGTWRNNQNIIAEYLKITSSNLDLELYFTDVEINNAVYYNFVTQGLDTQLRIRLYDANLSLIKEIKNGNYWNVFKENTYLTIAEYQGNGVYNDALTLLTYKENKLDNAFEYGMQRVEESNIYNWSKTTGAYTVLTNTCNLLGITNTFVPMLLAYWLIISVIYFIYDIALILVWMVHKKIHELTDAI